MKTKLYGVLRQFDIIIWTLEMKIKIRLYVVRYAFYKDNLDSGHETRD
jgi:hypothetical protein